MDPQKADLLSPALTALNQTRRGSGVMLSVPGSDTGKSTRRSVTFTPDDGGERVRRASALRDAVAKRRLSSSVMRRRSSPAVAQDDEDGGSDTECEALKGDPQLKWRLRRLFLCACSHGPAIRHGRLDHYGWEYLCQEADLVGPGQDGGWAGTISQAFLDTVWSATSRPSGELNRGTFVLALGAIALRRCPAPPAASRSGTTEAADEEGRALRVLWESNLQRVVDLYTVSASLPGGNFSVDPGECGWPPRTLGVVNCALAAALPLLKDLWQRFASAPPPELRLPNRSRFCAPQRDEVELLIRRSDWRVLLAELCPDLLTFDEQETAFAAAAGLDSPADATTETGLRVEQLASALVLGAVIAYVRSNRYVTIQSRVVEVLGALHDRWMRMHPGQYQRELRAGDLCTLATTVSSGPTLRPGEFGQCVELRKASDTGPGFACVVEGEPRPGTELVWVDATRLTVVHCSASSAIVELKADAVVRSQPLDTAPELRWEQRGATLCVADLALVRGSRATTAAQHELWRPAYEYEVRLPPYGNYDSTIPEFKQRCPFKTVRSGDPRRAPPPVVVPVPTGMSPTSGGIADSELVQISGMHFAAVSARTNPQDMRRDLYSILQHTESEDMGPHDDGPPQPQGRRESRRASRVAGPRRASCIGRQILRKVSLICGVPQPEPADVRTATKDSKFGGEVFVKFGQSVVRGHMERRDVAAALPPPLASHDELALLASIKENAAGSWGVQLLWHHAVSVEVSTDGVHYSVSGLKYVYEDRYDPLPLPADDVSQLYELYTSERYGTSNLSDGSRAIGPLGWRRFKQDFYLSTPTELPLGLPPDPEATTPPGCDFIFSHAAAPCAGLTKDSVTTCQAHDGATEVRTETPQGKVLKHPCDLSPPEFAEPRRKSTSPRLQKSMSAKMREQKRQSDIQVQRQREEAQEELAAVTFSGFILVLVWNMLGQKRVMNPVLAIRRLLRRKDDRAKILKLLDDADKREDPVIAPGKVPCVDKWLRGVAGLTVDTGSHLQCPKGSALRPRNVADGRQPTDVPLLCSVCRAVGLPREVFRSSQDGDWTVCPRCYGRLAGVPNFRTEKVAREAQFALEYHTRHDVVAGNVDDAAAASAVPRAKDDGLSPRAPQRQCYMDWLDAVAGAQRKGRAPAGVTDTEPPPPLHFERAHEDGGLDVAPAAVAAAASLRQGAEAVAAGRRVVRVSHDANTHVLIRGLPADVREEDVHSLLHTLCTDSDSAALTLTRERGTVVAHVRWPPQQGQKGRTMAERLIEQLRGHSVRVGRRNCYLRASWSRFHHQVARGGEPAPPELPPPPRRRPVPSLSKPGGGDEPAAAGRPTPPKLAGGGTVDGFDPVSVFGLMPASADTPALPALTALVDEVSPSPHPGLPVAYNAHVRVLNVGSRRYLAALRRGDETPDAPFRLSMAIHTAAPSANTVFELQAPPQGRGDDDVLRDGDALVLRSLVCGSVVSAAGLLADDSRSVSATALVAPPSGSDAPLPRSATWELAVGGAGQRRVNTKTRPAKKTEQTDEDAAHDDPVFLEMRKSSTLISDNVEASDWSLWMLEMVVSPSRVDKVLSVPLSRCAVRFLHSASGGHLCANKSALDADSELLSPRPRKPATARTPVSPALGAAELRERVALTPRPTHPGSPERERELNRLGGISDPYRTVRSRAGVKWTDTDRDRIYLGPPKTLFAPWR